MHFELVVSGQPEEATQLETQRGKLKFVFAVDGVGGGSWARTERGRSVPRRRVARSGRCIVSCGREVRESAATRATALGDGR